MEKSRRSDSVPDNWFSRFFGRWLDLLDNLVLIVVAIGIVSLAIILLAEGISDFYYFESHSIPHIVSELMFVLILMELFRQVVRQLKRHSFSLHPFFFIGVIASIRGILLVQMKLAMGGRRCLYRARTDRRIRCSGIHYGHQLLLFLFMLHQLY